MTDLQKLLEGARAAQIMQEKLEEVKRKLNEVTVVGEAGGGLVKVALSGRNEVRSVDIDDSLMREDKEVIEDLLAAALTSALEKAGDRSSAIVKEATEGLELPSGETYPF